MIRISGDGTMIVESLTGDAAGLCHSPELGLESKVD